MKSLKNEQKTEKFTCIYYACVMCDVILDIDIHKYFISLDRFLPSKKFSLKNLTVFMHFSVSRFTYAWNWNARIIVLNAWLNIFLFWLLFCDLSVKHARKPFLYLQFEACKKGTQNAHNIHNKIIKNYNYTGHACFNRIQFHLFCFLNIFAYIRIYHCTAYFWWIHCFSVSLSTFVALKRVNPIFTWLWVYKCGCNRVCSWSIQILNKLINEAWRCSFFSSLSLCVFTCILCFTTSILNLNNVNCNFSSAPAFSWFRE